MNEKGWQDMGSVIKELLGVTNAKRVQVITRGQIWGPMFHDFHKHF